MSELIKHECGIALLRLLKPLEYYQQKYGSWDWPLKKLYLLMEKQHNRGQDGAGLITFKLNSLPGKEYIHRVRSNASEPIKDVFKQIDKQRFSFLENLKTNNDTHWVQENMPFVGEVLMAHLRYGTFGKNDINSVHPVLRRSNWKSKTLALQGNFNLTNVDEIFQKLLYLGQHPREYSDTITMLEKVGHFLDEENEQIFRDLRKKGLSKKECSPQIQQNIDVIKVLKQASQNWDGGYAISGIIGHGDAFVIRDPWGIRPVYYYYDDEIAVVASERPVIQTVVDVAYEEVQELKPGYALTIARNGKINCDLVRKPEQRKSCSFERIYFSRGSDKEIYIERKKLGRLLVPKVLETVDYDLKNTVFSYIPNTAETAFLGMIQELERFSNEKKINQIFDAKTEVDKEKLKEIICDRPRVEKLAIKDIKLRTFITQDNDRDDLVAHVYDVTYGIVNNTDNLVVIDDSIVRGTTLKQSIIKILSRLKPKKIVIVSSAPQIRYPDCYGIDMANLDDFVAFRPFTAEEISKKIAELLRPDDVDLEIDIIYQSIESLHEAIPEHLGDWYFTGDYPTPGGNKVVNTAFINYVEGKHGRAY